MIGEIPDPRRYEACLYSHQKDYAKLQSLIALDNELWAAFSRSKEPVLAQIRMQFWLDEIVKIQNLQEVSTPISVELNTNFQKKPQVVSKIMELINAHIDGIEFHPNRINDYLIWQKYFELAFCVFEIEASEITEYCAQIISAASKGDFTKYNNFAPLINKKIKQLNSKTRARIIPIIGFLKLARNSVLFENIIEYNGEKRLGLRAKMVLFGANLFGRI